MSRELKFRAWDKKQKKMLYGVSIGTIKVWDENAPLISHEFSYSEDCIIEQYTGLKDKNGKKIYEGDIVEFGLAGRGERGYVAYADEYASFEVYSKRDFIFGCLFGHAGTVIGNIHENPELLED